MFKNNKYILFLVLLTFAFSGHLFPQSTDREIFLSKLNTIDGIKYSEIKHDSTFEFAYEIYFPQKVDHKNPSSKTFRQRIFLYHRSYLDPTVLVTEGYNAVAGRHSELTNLLNANEIIVEHRYFDKSRPDTIIWKYLTVEQAANDHHRIIQFFKDLYRSRWISTGISKGGQTCIMLKYYFPDDVDITVPYVAPLNMEQEDHRIYKFLRSVGTAEERNKILKFQRAVLKNRKEIFPLFQQYVKDKELTFYYDLNLIFEYTVFEYSFSFWQWGHDIADIPEPGSSPEVLFNHFIDVSDPAYFSKQQMDEYSPFMYQAYSEEGYYGYETKDFTDLLISVKDEIASSRIFAPDYKNISYNKHLMKDIAEWLKNDGNNMLYIYGGTDTWSATSVDIGHNTNAVKMVKSGGSHKTRIKSFSDEEREKIYSTIEKWLSIEIPTVKVL